MPAPSGQILISDFVANNNEEQQSYCDELNKNNIANYVRGVANYNLFEDQVGLKPSWAPPSIPLKWILGPADPDNGLQFAMQSSLPAVEEPLSIHTIVNNIVTPNTIIVGKRQGKSSWFQAGQLDSFPNGMDTPPNWVSEEGVVGTFTKFGNPVTTNGAVHGVYLLKQVGQ